MQARNVNLKSFVARLALTAALSLLIALPVAAQSGGNIPDDYYRAEIVILERLVDPDTITEQMAGKTIEPLEPAKLRMWVEDANGNVSTDLRLVPTGELHLSSAIDRLERSGKYRVLASAGWYEAFPPDYQGEPLQVETGEWLPAARQHSVEGRITIDRQRFLHVDVQLNHWQVDEVAMPPAPLELITWIRETRRMRSEEIHFIDSPTIGVLVFFKKIEAEG
ncbi:MAG TPA: CsiV family protein [Marinobacter sp.]|nr:CsiV family protein [Marinobacter sp.]